MKSFILLRLVISILVFISCELFICNSVFADPGSKLLATSGVTNLEGTAGGGLTPWAVIAGYDSNTEIGSAVAHSRTDVQNYRLYSYAANIGFYNRVELSAAHQTFDLKQSSAEINQNIIGLKVRLIGDLIFGNTPQISLGLQHKALVDTAIANSARAKNTAGTDFYAVTSRLWLGALNGYNIFGSIAVRATRANQMGLLGFGGDKNNNYQLKGEATAAVFLNRHWAVGTEFRQKPDNISSLKEENWQDIFIGWFPSHDLALTFGYAKLGEVAGAKNQHGSYLALQGSF